MGSPCITPLLHLKGFPHIPSVANCISRASAYPGLWTSRIDPVGRPLSAGLHDSTPPPRPLFAYRSHPLSSFTHAHRLACRALLPAQLRLAPHPRQHHMAMVCVRRESGAHGWGPHTATQLVALASHGQRAAAGLSARLWPGTRVSADLPRRLTRHPLALGRCPTVAHQPGGA